VSRTENNKCRQDAALIEFVASEHFRIKAAEKNMTPNADGLLLGWIP
jgi:hypothetical protein